MRYISVIHIEQSENDQRRWELTLSLLWKIKKMFRKREKLWESSKARVNFITEQQEVSQNKEYNNKEGLCQGDEKERV